MELEQVRMRISQEFSRHLLEVVLEGSQKLTSTSNESAYSGFTITDEFVLGQLPVTSPQVKIVVHQARF